MAPPRLRPVARAFVAAVIAAGAVSAAWLLERGDPAAWSAGPVLTFGVLTLAFSAISPRYKGTLPTSVSFQVGTAFLYALLLLADAGAAAVVVATLAAFDAAVQRRRAVVAFFNGGQLLASLAVSIVARDAIAPGFTMVDPLDGRSLTAAVGALVAFFLANHLSTHAVVSLSSGRPFWRFGKAFQDGALTEALCIVSGLAMAILWTIRPALSALAGLPIVLLLAAAVQLGRRQERLARVESELRSLQDLGLELGAELDADRLKPAIVRIAPEALEASGALFGVLEDDGRTLRVLAHHGLRPPPPARLVVSRLSDGFFETKRPRLVADFAAEREMYPELTFLDAVGIVAAPLSVPGRPGGLLLVAHGPARRPFDGDDARRLATLARFVETALANASMVSELRAMQEHLVHNERLSALGTLVAGVAHEIEGPLAAIVGFGEMSRRDVREPAGRAALTRIVDEAQRATRLVQSVLSFARKRAPERRRSDVNAAVLDIIELRRLELAAAGIEIERSLQPTLPAVLADPDRLRQVVFNLVVNAEQALRGAGRPRGRITVETRAADGGVRCTVRDDGPGIAEEDLSRIFLPFFTTKRANEGTGLGLAICHGIAREHGGRLEVTSVLGRGAAFTLWLPRAPGDAADRQTRLLLLDEEGAITPLVRAAFEPRGWTIVETRSGREALQRLADGPFDALLVELEPRAEESRAFLDTVRGVRPDLAGRIVVSAEVSDAESGRAAESAGATLLAKPWSADAALDAVSRAAAGGSVH